MNSSKKVLGITGLYCSGKSSADKILLQYGYKIIDVDLLGHEALDICKDLIVKNFGKDILKNKVIDRKKLGGIVFSCRDKLNELNKIVHPVMIKMVKERMASGGDKICINAALLFEMGLDELCSAVCIIKSSLFNIIKKAKKRDGYSFWKVLRIINNQKVNYYANKKKQNVDIFYVSNNYNLHNFTDKFIKTLRERNYI